MIKFTADHYFQIGATHLTAGKPCQDYALSSADELIGCAVVSDGCSTGRHTDIGSRVLALSTLQAIRDHAVASGGSVHNAVVSITARQQQMLGTTRLLLGLTPDDMLATCSYIYLTPGGGVVHIQGDGVVALKYRDGRINMGRYEWAENRPFYPAYVGPNLEAFVAAHGGHPEAIRLRGHWCQSSADGSYVEAEPEELTLAQGIVGTLLPIVEAELNDLEFVAIFSDGVAQMDKILWPEAVSQFLSFRTTQGDFAKRRMIWGIRESHKLGKGPTDDIAYAVVKIGHPESKGET